LHPIKPRPCRAYTKKCTGVADRPRTEINVTGGNPVILGVRPLKTMTPNDVCQLVESLCEGNDNAFHTLIEAEKTIIPLLTQQFTTHACGADRARIIEVIWQHRDKATIPFLASVLNDGYPEVWKQAIDGLVTIGGTESVEALQLFRGQLKDDDARLPWIAEAIEQMESNIVE
jgi:hypothetical protein